MKVHILYETCATYDGGWTVLAVFATYDAAAAEKARLERAQKSARKKWERWNGETPEPRYTKTEEKAHWLDDMTIVTYRVRGVRAAIAAAATEDQGHG